MGQNVIEALREASVNRLFGGKVFSQFYDSTWCKSLKGITSGNLAKQFLDIGDSLSDIFRSTGITGRGQDQVSGGGAAWEALVAWYLNVCSIGRRTVIIKHCKALIPTAISDAITVNYHSFASNTESDLVAITFPDKPDYMSDKEGLCVFDGNGEKVPLHVKKSKKYNLESVMNALVQRDFGDIEVHVIQCKTNWNDNAQIPMLWDMIYSATNFRNNVTIGRNGYSIIHLANFTYSFVTVPTSKQEGIKEGSICVQRVMNLSGGTYWGKKSENNVANSLKEMLNRNLSKGHAKSHLSTLQSELSKLKTDYRYFRL